MLLLWWALSGLAMIAGIVWGDQYVWVTGSSCALMTAAVAIRQTISLRQRASVDLLGNTVSLVSPAGCHRGDLEELSEPIFCAGQNAANEEQLMTAAFRLLRERFRSRAIVVALQEQGQSCRYYAYGIHGDRFRSHFLGRIRSFFHGGPLVNLGFSDGLESDSVLGEFSIFGFRYSICFPIEIPCAGPVFATRGVLWLGYSASQPPLDSEVSRARAAAKNLEEAIRSTLAVERLSGRVEEAESLNREKTEVIAHLSHDLRSPLGNIKAILSLFKLESTSEETQTLIDTALSNCEHVADIVGDLLDYSRHNLGKLQAREELVCVCRIAQSVVESFSVAARAKGLSLSFQSALERGFVLADKRHLTRIVSNIVSNALKYTLRGEVRVGVSREDDFIRIVVSDSGVGMSPDQVRRLFTPFTRFQGDGIEGIGLGMALSKILTELNGGKIGVSSQTGKGSTFTLRFPSAADSSVPVRGESAPIEIKPSLFGAKILVVDDDADCVETLSRILYQQGCEVLKALTVQDALGLLNYEVPQMIISDANMPGGGARAFLERIRAVTPQIPVLLLSGSVHDGKEYLELGASECMSKPANIPAVLNWMEQQLKGLHEMDKFVLRATA